MRSLRSVPNSVRWRMRVGAERRLQGLSPGVMDWALHAFERVGAPNELNLDVPSWATTKIEPLPPVNLADADSLFVPPVAEFPEERQHWATLRVHALSNVSLDVDSGLCFSRDRVISQCGSGNRSARDAAFISGAYARYRKTPASDGPSLIAPLGDTWHHYHFMVETLPRMLHARSAHPDLKFVASQSLSDAAADVLEALEIEVVRLPAGQVIHGSVVILVDHPVKFWPRPIDLKVAREALLHRYPPAPSRPEKPIYVSRTRGGSSPHHEQHLQDQLVSHGVEVVYFEELSVSRQIDVAAQASTLIGFHGAGLTNLMFMNEGCSVVEVSSGHDFEPCYRRMSAAQDREYRYIQVPGSQDAPHGAVTSETASQVMSAVDELSST